MDLSRENGQDSSCHILLRAGLSVKHETTQSRGSAKKSHLGIVIILGSGVPLGIFPVSWGSAGCLWAVEGSVPRPASSHGPRSKQGTVLRLHMQSLQLHYWITLTGRPLVSYFITWVKKKWAGRVKKCVVCLSEHQQERQPQKQPRNISVEHVRKFSVRLKSLKFGVFSWGSESQLQKARGKYHKTCAEFSFKINDNISVGGYSNTVVYMCIYISNVKYFVLLYVHRCHSGR